MKLKFAPHHDRAEPIVLPLCEPLLIRLTEDVGKLPAGFVYELPRFEAERLLHKRKAVAVGSIGTMADLSLTEDECEEAGLSL
jgi:hypothetical protein